MALDDSAQPWVAFNAIPKLNPKVGKRSWLYGYGKKSVGKDHDYGQLKIKCKS